MGGGEFSGRPASAAAPAFPGDVSSIEASTQPRSAGLSCGEIDHGPAGAACSAFIVTSTLALSSSLRALASQRVRQRAQRTGRPSAPSLADSISYEVVQFGQVISIGFEGRR